VGVASPPRVAWEDDTGVRPVSAKAFDSPVITFRLQIHRVCTKLSILQVHGSISTHLSSYFMRSIIL
jgi:hypothetical protein